MNQRQLETFKERWWNQNPEKKVCEDEVEDTGGGISIYNIGGVFIVIFVGIALAIVTLIVEYWYYKHKKPMSSINTAAGQTAIKQLQIKQQFGNNDKMTTEYGMGGPAAAATADILSTPPPPGPGIPEVDKNW